MRMKFMNTPRLLARGLKRGLIGLALSFGSFRLYAQEMVVLSQEREGSATVYLSERDKLAVILDGGKKGGLTSPRMGGKPPLAFLLGRGVSRLVIECSHPHDDHSAGLREIVTSSLDLPQFADITFVDSGYPVAQSLFELFRTTHPSYPEERVRYRSAKGYDALAKAVNGHDLVASNLRYKPSHEASVHGHAIISQFTLHGTRGDTRIVDFDDADDTLVAEWAHWAATDPTS